MNQGDGGEKFICSSSEVVVALQCSYATPARCECKLAMILTACSTVISQSFEAL